MVNIDDRNIVISKKNNVSCIPSEDMRKNNPSPRQQPQSYTKGNIKTK